MFKSFDFCLPSKSTTVPAGPDWLHEIKYDGYRLRVERDGDRIRLITRGGYNWTHRYPWIAEAARKIRQKQFVLDGEAVVLGVDSVADFTGISLGQVPQRMAFEKREAVWLVGDAVEGCTSADRARV